MDEADCAAERVRYEGSQTSHYMTTRVRSEVSRLWEDELRRGVLCVSCLSTSFRVRPFTPSSMLRLLPSPVPRLGVGLAYIVLFLWQLPRSEPPQSSTSKYLRPQEVTAFEIIFSRSP